ncbi:hypothetical protein J659_4119 [Acinetobacter baumannii 1406589]|jgi:branched-subunit amino acid ABC-type transport system permease component|uniref:hypothetical protein n=1 Tax=Acinetobacter baumannii TaxID=470 RepID=UPI00044CA7C3|nr:hypothetical protein [Acinetobacter baumannii]EXS51043.1 hypothetical protein J659_4119 [Acinetobacter baumannii 1406589]MDC4147553.1 hypothetical protein [Acinetobacter baumannii]
MHYLDDEFIRKIFAATIVICIGSLGGGFVGLIIGILNSIPPFSYFNYEIDPIKSSCVFALIGWILAVIAIINALISEKKKNKLKKTSQKAQTKKPNH